VVDYKLRTGSLQGYPEAEPISNEDLLELDVTVLFPAALESVITVANADRIRCSISCELANGPMTPRPMRFSSGKGSLSCPIPGQRRRGDGLLLRAGSETPTISTGPWPRSSSGLDEKMTRAFHGVYQMYQREKVNMREAAYLVSVARVAEACKLGLGLRGR